MKSDRLIIANKKLVSRLIVGTGKYKSFLETAKAVKASGADMVTVAVRRVNILDKRKPILTDYLNPKKIIFLPNTAGCFTSSEALRTLRLAREMGGWKLVKLEVLGDKKTLYPNMIETLKSTKTLVKEGFKVMVYCTDDPLLAKKLEDNGASANLDSLLDISVLPTPVGPIISIFLGRTSSFISPSIACLLHLFLKAIATALLALSCPTTNLSNSDTISLGDNESESKLIFSFLSFGLKVVTFDLSIIFFLLKYCYL